jgi:hypothetical protein
MHPEEYTAIYDVRTSTKAYEEALSFSGFGMVNQKDRGGSVEYDEAKQNWLGRHIHLTYGKGFIVEKELWDDAQTNTIAALPRALARSVRHTIEYLGADRLNNPSSTGTAYVLSDGKALLATDHPLGKGGTFQNRPTNFADLDSTSLEQAYIDIGDWVDDASLNIAARPKRLIVPTELAWQCAKLLGSDKVPEDANNAINPAKGVLPYNVNHYLTDADAWFIITDIPNGMTFYWRRRPDFSMDNDFDTENAKWKTIFRCVTGCDDPRGIYGNTGG